MRYRDRHALRDVLASLALAWSIFGVPAIAAGQTSTSILYVTAQVANSCSFDSTLINLLSVTCSLETPLATSSVAASIALADGPTRLATPDHAHSTAKPPLKLCNTLASSILENDSFNQFAIDIDRKTQFPSHYFSTLQICF